MGTSGTEVGVGSYGEMEEQNQKLESLQEPSQDITMGGQMKRLLWHGGSVYDAWFSAASNQVHIRPQPPRMVHCALRISDHRLIAQSTASREGLLWLREEEFIPPY